MLNIQNQELPFQSKESPRAPRKDDFIRSQKEESVFEVEILRYSNGLVDMIFDLLCTFDKWAVNANAELCAHCQRRFGLLLRKHHCRACGRIFCGTCSDYRLHLKYRRWAEHTDIIEVFTKQLRCVFNAKMTRFELKICANCFQTDLDRQIGELTDIDGIKKYLRQSLIGPSARQRRTSIGLTTFPLKDKIQVEFAELLLSELKAELGEEAPSLDFLKDFLVNIFAEFEALTKYKLDFNAVNISDLIPIIRLPETELSIEFFPGLVLQLDSNTYYDQAHNINFPNILLLRKNFCPAGTPTGFHYYAVEDLDRVNRQNIEFIESLVNSRNINIVISEHPLPAQIYFLLKSKKMDVIFPLKHSKINLIEKITKSSQLRTHFEKNYRHGPNSGEVEELWLPGELEIREVKILERNFSYYAYIKKNNPRKSFNTFSIIIKGPTGQLTKVLKEKLQRFMPMIFYKFFEHTIVNTEMMVFNTNAKYDFSKSFLKNKLFTLGHSHQLGNFIETENFFKPLTTRGYRLDFHSTVCMLQIDDNTFNEFQSHYHNLLDEREDLLSLLATTEPKPIEFLALFALYSNEKFAYLANLNLSKSTEMLKLCELPEHSEVSLFSHNDVSVIKFVLETFTNLEILCSRCSYKFKFHRRFFYLNSHVIRLQCFSIDYVNGDLIIPKPDFLSGFTFDLKPKVFPKPTQPNLLKNFEDGKLRFGLFCESCQHIIGSLLVLPESYRNMSFALYLYFYSLELSPFDDEMPGTRPRKDTHRTLFDAMFQTQPELPDICVHPKLTRAFFMNGSFFTLAKIPVTKFQLLTNSQLKGKPVDITKKLSRLQLWQKNFKFLVNYYISVLRLLEERILENSADPSSRKNLQTIESGLEFYSLLLQLDPISMATKSQLKANEDFFRHYRQLINKFTHFRLFSADLVLQFDTELRFDNISTVINFLQSKYDVPEFKSPPGKEGQRLRESISSFEIKSITHGSFNSNQTQSFAGQFRKSGQKTNQENLSLPIQSLDSEIIAKPTGEFIVGEYEFFYFDNPVNKYSNLLYSTLKLRQDGLLAASEKNLTRDVQLTLDEELEVSRLNFTFDSDDEAAFNSLLKENRLLLALTYRKALGFRLVPAMPKTVRFKLKEYFPQAFESLRQYLRVDIHHFTHSLSQIENFSPSGGQTNASFFITHDGKYVVKEISKREFGYFKNFCMDYVKYMLENSTVRAPSFLCRILGMFKSERRIFVVMENLTYYAGELITGIKNYDLKGSELNRFKLKVKPNSTLTDTNFLIERNGDPLYLQGSAITNIWQILSKDSLFLEQKNIIDYSLFVSLDINKRVCFMKIIDFFRSYDLIKNVETKWKTMRNKELPTIINPQEYRSRFLHNSRKYFIVTE